MTQNLQIHEELLLRAQDTHTAICIGRDWVCKLRTGSTCSAVSFLLTKEVWTKVLVLLYIVSKLTLGYGGGSLLLSSQLNPYLRFSK